MNLINSIFTNSLFKKLILFSIFLLVFGESWGQTTYPTVYFSNVYQGDSSATYSTNSNSIDLKLLLRGSNFKFVGTIAGTSFTATSGNNVGGVFSFEDVNGNTFSIRGVISRQEKSGSTVRGFYFYANSSHAYLFVIPGFEANFSAPTNNVGTSSDFRVTDLNNFLTAQTTLTTNSNDVCQSATASSLTAKLTSSSIQYYKWYYNSTNTTSLTGATLVTTQTTTAQTATYTPSSSVVGTRYYFVQVLNSSNQQIGISNTVAVTVNAPPTISSYSATYSNSQSVCQYGIPANSFIINATAGSGSGPYYQWYSNSNNTNSGGTAINGATNASFAPPTNTVGTKYYYCVITNSNGCSVTSNVSGAVSVTSSVYDGGSISGSTSVCSGTNSTTLTVSGYTAGLSVLRWESSTLPDFSSNITQISNTTTSITSNNITTTTYFRAVLNGTCNIVQSTYGSIVVNPNTSISTQPSSLSQTLCQNASPTPLSVTADGGNLTYAWYSNNSNSNSGGSLISGATSSTYSPPTSTTGTKYYYVIVSGSCGSSVTSSISGSIVINTLTAVPTLSASSIVCGSTGANLNITLTGTTPWDVTYSDGSSTFNVYGITASGLLAAVNPTTTTTYTISGVVDGNNCQANLNNSVTLTVTVPSAPTASITQPTCATATGTVSVTSGISGLTFTLSNNSNTYTNSTGVFSGIPSGNYSLTSTSSGGCISSALNVTINAQPTTPSAPVIGILTQPTCSVATGSVALSGLPNSGTWTLTYRSTSISGTGSTTTISGLSAGTYTFTVSNGSCSSVASSSATINTQPITPSAPTIGTITQPTCSEATGSVALSGLPASGTWTVTATGGSTITGSGSTATFSGLNAGTYNFTVSNGSCTSVASSSATINVQPTTPTAPVIGTLTQPTCSLATGSVALSGLPSSGTWTVTASNGATITGTNTSTAVFSGLSAGNYTFTASNGTCTSVASISATINAQPTTPSLSIAGVGDITNTETSFIIELTNITNSPISYNLLAGTNSYTGTFSSTGTISGTAITATISGGYTGTYDFILNVTNASGCTSPNYNFSLRINTVDAGHIGIIDGSNYLHQKEFCTTNDLTVISNEQSASAGATYQWQYSTNSNPLTEAYSNITVNGTSSVYTVTSGLQTQTTHYRRVATLSGSYANSNLVTIKINTVPLAPTATVTDPTCTVNTGSINVTSGPSGLTFSLNTGSGTITNSTGVFTGLNSGNYSLTSTNVSGCTSAVTSLTIGVVPPSSSTPTASITQPTCSTATGSISVTSSLTGYSFSIDGTNYSNTTGVFNAVSSGSYSLTAKNVSGCISSATPIVVNAQPAAPSVTIGTISQITTTSNSFDIPFTIISGAPTTYSLSTGTPALSGFTNISNASLPGTSPIVVSIPASAANNYAFNISFSNGTCTSSTQNISLTIISTSLLSSTITATGTITYTYNGNTQGPSTSTVSGSTGAVTYSYSGTGSTTYGPSASRPTNVGTYQLVASVDSDASYNGASSSPLSFTIGAASTTITATGTTTYKYTGSAQGPSTSTVSGSTGAVTYSYSGTGSTTYGPSATKPTDAGTYEVVATVAADANYNGASSSPLEFTISPLISLPAPPNVKNATYIFNSPGIPTNIRPLVVSYPIGTVPVWCDLNTSICDTAAPKTPTAIGIYIYALKSYDTTSSLYSAAYSYDTLIIKPPVPTINDSTYILGLKTNPKTVNVQFVILSNATPKYYIQSNNNVSVPNLPTATGTFKYTISQVVNNIESDTISFKVKMIDLNDVIHLQKIVDSGKLQVNSTFNYPFKFIVTNLTSYPFNNVVLTDNLQNSVPITANYNVVNKISGNSLLVNNSYNGNTDINITTSASKLPANTKDSVSFTMNLVPNGYTGDLYNTAYVNAETIWGPVTMQSSPKTWLEDKSKSATKYYVEDIKVFIPEGFSPNRDGVNDTYVIIRPYYLKIQLEVFNRWGNNVYQNADYKNDWDGKGNTSNFAGVELVDGGYYYIVKAVDNSGKAATFQGSLIIQR